MGEFFKWLGAKKSAGIRMAVMDMWKPFRNSTKTHAPQASILFDKFHVLRHLGEALDTVRKSEYARLSGKDRRFIKGQKYTLLSGRENLTLEGRQSLKLLLAANRRLNTAYLLKESFGQLWDYTREGWARRFFETWRDSLKWQRLKPYEKFAEMIERHWDGIAAHCAAENKVALGFVEGLNNKVRVIQRRAHGLRDEEYLRLKVLTCMLPAIWPPTLYGSLCGFHPLGNAKSLNYWCQRRYWYHALTPPPLSPRLWLSSDSKPVLRLTGL
jgi:transposase